jgi:hypothetical protein
VTAQDFLARARRAAQERDKAETFDRLYERYSASYGVRGSALLALADLGLVLHESQAATNLTAAVGRGILGPNG